MKATTRTGSAVALALLAASAAAQAETLSDALSDAYGGNATIEAQRFRQRGTDEQLPQALSGWRPTVTVTGSIDRGHQYFGFAFPGTPTIQDVTPRTAILQLDQPIYRGGATQAGVDKAHATIAAGQSDLSAVEQQQLLLAATAYLDAYRDQAIVGLSEALVKVLDLNQHDVLATFKAGAATETDTSQAAARLQGAIATEAGAEAQLAQSRARFRETVGRDAGTLDTPSVLGQVPASEDEAVTAALASSPEVIAARQRLEAAKHQVDVARAGLLPKVDGILQAEHLDDELIKGIRENAVQVGVQATVPLYESGTVYAQVRAAHEAVSEAETEVTVAERQLRDEVTEAWTALKAAEAQQAQYRSQITANDVALRDTGKEVTVGTRTRLDVLNAEQELFGSRVNLVSAEHDALVATFRLETVTGRFTPSALGLKVPDYDPAKHLDQVKGKWWGTTPPDDK